MEGEPFHSARKTTPKRDEGGIGGLAKVGRRGGEGHRSMDVGLSAALREVVER